MLKKMSRGYPESPVGLPDASAKAIYGSDVIADLLSAMGFEHAFLLPGSSFRGLHDSLVNHTRNVKPEIVLCTSEIIAVAAGHGYAKALGKPALCIVHNLAGLMVGSMSIFNAWCDQMPLVILGGSGPLDPGKRRFMDWMHSASTQADLIKDLVKWTSEPPTLTATVDAILRGHKIASTPPYGPVYISIDQGVQESIVEAGFALPDITRPMYLPPEPLAAAPAAIDKAADMLIAAERPLIIGGRIGYDAAATRPLVEIVELLGAAYVDDRNVSCIPTDHPQNLSGDETIRAAADVVLAVDCPDPTMTVGAYGKVDTYRPGQKLIDMSVNFMQPNSWSNVGGPLPPIELQIPCAPLLGLDQLIAALRARRPDAARASTRQAELRARHDALRHKQREGWKVRAGEVPIVRPAVAHAICEAIKGKPWTLAVRQNRGVDEGIWPISGAGIYHGYDGGGGVGYGPGAVVGAALALKAQKRICVAVIGDGEFLMAAGALWTAAHYRVPLLLVIVNNTSWGNDENHQINVAKARQRPVDNAWIGQRMIDPDIDLSGLARCYGAWSEGPVEDPATMVDVMKRAVAAVEAGRCSVVEVRTEL